MDPIIEESNVEPLPWETEEYLKEHPVTAPVTIKSKCSKCLKNEAEIRGGYCEACKNEVYGIGYNDNVKTKSWEMNKERIKRRIQQLIAEDKEADSGWINASDEQQHQQSLLQ